MKLKELTDKNIIINFYKNNPSKYVLGMAEAMEEDELVEVTYCGLYFGEELIAITAYSHMTDHLAMMQSTTVKSDHRGIGIGRTLNTKIEEYLKGIGYGKIVSHIYIDNLPSIILKLKLGYVIEGLLKDHDVVGQHEYILGKLI